ncbi:MAG: hypothetical protein HXS48_21900 [Theionarchaea archaeon]|nr:MAG: hypothetical protein AYK19_16535 [Theionarchaea archaeon DG-70-1]MBU7029602.1 hypothetical protein [Theionarchaea archaeon]
MKLPKINKSALIWALNDRSGFYSYLDLETGEILSTIDYEIDEEEVDEERYVYIDPISSHEAYNFMVEFIETVEDQELKRRLYTAIDGRGAFRMFEATLMEYPEERERWSKFHDKKMEECADEWLEDLSSELKEKE